MRQRGRPRRVGSGTPDPRLATFVTVVASLETMEDGGGPNGPYVNNVDDILDPWGNQFVLVNPGNVNLTWDITSYGEDGQLGGEGPNADVTN